MHWVKQCFANGLCVDSISPPAGWGAAEQAAEQWDQRTVETPLKTQSQGEDVLHLRSAFYMGVRICFPRLGGGVCLL